jgi:hypothetical protein
VTLDFPAPVYNKGPVTRNRKIVCRSLNAIVTQLKNCPFCVNTTIELKTIKTTNNNKQKNSSKVNTYKAILKY